MTTTRTQKYLSILPDSIPSSGKVSFSRGTPIVTITLGRQDAVLDLASLRLSGDLDIWSNAAGTVHPSAANSTKLLGSHKLGIYGAIDQLVFRHAETKQVIEHLRFAGRFMSSMLPCMASVSDVTSHLGESALIMPNYQSYRDNVVRNTAASPFTIPLVSGLTLGATSIPLDKLPLEIEIHLASESQFFHTTDGTTADSANAFYELSNLELTCEVAVGAPSPDKGQLVFNSITSYFSTLESTNAIINFNLGLSKVLSAFVNFVPSSFVNNLGQDGYLTYMPSLASAGGGQLANLRTISFLKNGERFPSSFEVDSVRSATNLTSVVDPQVISGFLGSIVPQRAHDRTSVGPENTNRNYVVNNSLVNGYRVMPDSGAAYGVGVLYDQLDSQGEDFSNSQFSIQMTNELTDGNPISAYLFIKSKVVVAWSDTMGVQVQM